MGLFKILYSANNLKNIYFEKIFKKKEDSEIRRMQEILEECKKIDKMERIPAINLVLEGNSLYKKMCGKRGQNYCSKNLPDADKRLKNLTEKLINYNS
jgi:hypothetical protein